MNFFLLLLTLCLIPIFLPEISADTNIIRLKPIEDTYVITNLKPGVDNLQDLNFGDFTFLKMWYKLDGTRDGDNIGTFGLLKFDLSDLDPKKIQDAKLVMKPYVVITEKNQTLFNIYPIPSNWDEDTVTWNSMPKFTWLINSQSHVSQPNKQVIWDVTSYVQDKAGAYLGLALGYESALTAKEELVTFYSKEAENPDDSPFLEIEYSGELPQSWIEPKSDDIILLTNLTPTDDAFVIANLSVPPDQDKFRQLNTADFKFIQVSYGINATGNEQNYISIPFLKFNLNDVQSDNLVSAILKATPFEVSHYSPSYIDLFYYPDNDWSESEISFNSVTLENATIIQNSPSIFDGITYQWDLTDSVKKNTGSEYTIAMMFHDSYQNVEEIASFYSSEADDPQNSIYLEIKSLQESSDGGGCLIATAAYGSELAPQVQQLRELRDNKLLQTESGAAFMNSFNDFYYSFSPTIADYERENPVFKEAVKLVITPMISSLSILNHVDMDSEAEVLGYGISLIILNIGMYFVAPAIVIMRLIK